MTQKYIQKEFTELVWCKKLFNEWEDCGSDVTDLIWATWPDRLPPFPYIDRHSCLIEINCYPWEINDIIYDIEGKWQVILRGNWSLTLVDAYMYDCYPVDPPTGEYLKPHHLDYILVHWALLDFLEPPVLSGTPAILEGLTLLGMGKQRFAWPEGFGINLEQKKNA